MKKTGKTVLEDLIDEQINRVVEGEDPTIVAKATPTQLMPNDASSAVAKNLAIAEANLKTAHETMSKTYEGDDDGEYDNEKRSGMAEKLESLMKETIKFRESIGCEPEESDDEDDKEDTPESDTTRGTALVNGKEDDKEDMPEADDEEDDDKDELGK